MHGWQVPADARRRGRWRRLNDGLVQVMKAGKATPFAQRVATLTPIVQSAFDLPLILQNSVGPARWASISGPAEAAR